MPSLEPPSRPPPPDACRCGSTVFDARFLPNGTEATCLACGCVLFIPWTAGGCGVRPILIAPGHAKRR
jgi:hypothetical protein